MRLLAVDIGTGTQDILVLDTRELVENAFQMVMPSPTQIAAAHIRRATSEARAVVLTGVIAGGGPCHWALEDHIRSGHKAFATAEAASTFDDDLDNVTAMGVTIVSDDEAATIDGEHVRLRDLDLDAIRTALAAFGVDGAFDGIAAGCLDHGAAPPGYSDRLFRFDHLKRIVEARNDLRAFAMLPDELPEYLTRARTLVACIDSEAPAVFLDTGPAAALGALQDPIVGERDEQVVVNLGNMHALCFHLWGTRIVSLYEHHTGEITTSQAEDFTERLAARTLAHDEVFGSKGHGAFYTDENSEPISLPDGQAGQNRILAVSGPRRGMLKGSRLSPYFAVPHGDMMMSGCYGLLWAFAEKYPAMAGEILPALGLDA